MDSLVPLQCVMWWWNQDKNTIMHFRLYRSPSKLHFGDRSLQWRNLWVKIMVGDHFWSYFQAHRNFRPGVTGRLVIDLVEVGRKKEHERASNIVPILFQITQGIVELVMNTNVHKMVSLYWHFWTNLQILIRSISRFKQLHSFKVDEWEFLIFALSYRLIANTKDFWFCI